MTYENLWIQLNKGKHIVSNEVTTGRYKQNLEKYAHIKHKEK